MLEGTCSGVRNICWCPAAPGSTETSPRAEKKNQRKLQGPGWLRGGVTYQGEADFNEQGTFPGNPDQNLVIPQSVARLWMLPPPPGDLFSFKNPILELLTDTFHTEQTIPLTVVMFELGSVTTQLFCHSINAFK